MKKIAIISEFNITGTNYGNRLQALALYSYISSHINDISVEYLYFDFYDKFIITGLPSFIERVQLLQEGLIRRIRNSRNRRLLSYRLKKCNEFSFKYMPLKMDAWTWEKLIDSDFDCIIVGSDVVWAQGRNKIGRIRFLDFETRKPFKKISYAASFGKEWIPNENVGEIVRCLKSFDAISVRELSTVSFLNKLNIHSTHVVDPTLLISRDEWELYESIPVDNSVFFNKSLKYVFCYLLDPDYKTISTIDKWANKNNYFVVYVPHASGNRDRFKLNNNRWIILDTCSPGEWIWLIHNAEYVFTNSFHGTVFSTIFTKKFIVVKRNGQIDINNRMIDYLNLINQIDKLIDISNISNINSFNWHYDEINKILREKIYLSQQFIHRQF